MPKLSQITKNKPRGSLTQQVSKYINVPPLQAQNRVQKDFDRSGHSCSGALVIRSHKPAQPYP